MSESGFSHLPSPYAVATLFFISLLFWSGRQPGQLGEAVSNEVVVNWNEIAYTIAYQHDQFNSFIGVRALAMTHLAIHNALNTIDRRYQTYAFNEDIVAADPIATVSQAAYDVLIAVYPDRMDTLKLVLSRWLSSIQDGKPKKDGILLGHKAASAILAVRSDDGHQANGDYTPMTKPGDYQYTPQFEGYVWKPDFSRVKSFTLDSLIQFRSPPPPALTSDSYAASYNEVKNFGKRGSTFRNADGTHYAHWWAEFGEHSWNRISRITAVNDGLSLWATARMFALINIDLYDIYLVSFDSKYKYDTWRPYTAIRNGEKDGNPATIRDEHWEPEMLTPPWPEYPSAHAAVGGGGAEIVANIFGSRGVSFTMESTSALPESKIRTYHNLDSAAMDCARSRIMNGYHFRFATDEGLNQGRRVARHILKNYLRPLTRSSR